MPCSHMHSGHETKFYILGAYFGDHSIDQLPRQVVAYALQHPETLIKSEIMHGETLILISDETDTKYRKRHTTVRTNVREP